MNQENQLKDFKALRHDQSRLDKARSLIARNSEYIQKASEIVADAASAAFPPSTSILTALTCVLNAAKSVSANYDNVEAFFDIMNTFLQRLSLLEGKLPREPAYRKMVAKVFCSLLALCSIVQHYTQHWGRLKAWAKALVEGSDDKLKKAYDDLNQDLADLEKATLMKTLRTAIETGEDVKALRDASGEIIETGHQTLIVAARIETGVQRAVRLGAENAQRGEEVLTTVHRLELMLQEGARQRAAAYSAKGTDSDDVPKRKLSVIDFLRGRFGQIHIAMEAKLKELEKAYIQGTFDWIEAHEAYKGLVSQECRVLHITGVDGIGKTTLCYSITRRLRAAFEKEDGASAAVLFVRDGPPTLTSATVMQGCCLQVAEQDHGYRDAVKTQLVSGNDVYSNIFAAGHLFGSLFQAQSKRRAVLVLDAVDTMDADGRWDALRDFIKSAAKWHLRIQFVVAASPTFKTGLDDLQPWHLDLTVDLMRTDFRAVAVATLNRNSFPTLTMLKPRWRKRLIDSVSASADRFLYVEHMLRRLNSIGKQSVILRELNLLPASTRAIYSLLLRDLMKYRTQQEHQQLQDLFVWMTYHFRDDGDITLVSTQLLLDLLSRVRTVTEENTIVIEEELNDRSSSFLKLTSRDRRDEVIEVLDVDDGKGENSNPEENDQGVLVDEVAELDGILSFRDSYMREYFLGQDPEAGWTITSSAGHLTMFRMATTILTAPTESGIYTRGNPLISYAAGNWYRHLSEVDIHDSDDETMVTVIECLFGIVSNRNRALAKLEIAFRIDGWDGWASNKFTIFGTQADVDDGLSVVSDWIDRAKKEPKFREKIFTPAISEWIEEMDHNPASMLVRLAKGHIDNWLNADDMNWGMAGDYRSYRWAVAALMTASEYEDMPEVTENKELQAHLDKVFDPSAPNNKRYETVAFAFPDVKPNARAYQKISHVAKTEKDIAYAIEVAELGLSMATETKDKFELQRDLGLCLSERGGLSSMSIYAGATTVDESSLVQALAAFESAYSLGSEYLRQSANTDKNLREGLASMCLMKAKTEVLLHKFDDSVATILNAILISTDWKFEPMEILMAYRDASKWECVIGTMKALGGPAAWVDALGWGDVPRDIVHRAAVETGETLFVGEVYRKCIAYQDAHDERQLTGVWQRLQLVEFERTVLRRFDEAKAQLLDVIAIGTRELLDPPTRESLSLADVLLEQFRAGRDLKERTVLLEESRRVVDLVRDRTGGDWGHDPLAMQVMMPYAHMLRWIGSAAEFQVTVDGIFQGCVQALTDTQTLNDFDGCQMLARVLSLLPGLEVEAQVALSWQFYSLDTSPAANEAVEGETGEAEPKSTEKAELLPPPPSEVSTYDIAIIETEVVCANCDKKTRSWDLGSFYLCYCCANRDLCAECYATKAAIDQGDQKAGWRVVCPMGHKHVRGPVEGWKGVRAGVLYMDKTPPIRFGEWLGELKIKWTAAWEKYWLGHTF